MQTNALSFSQPVHFGTRKASPESVRNDLEKLLKDKAGLEPANTKVYLEKDKTMVEIFGAPFIMVYGNPRHDGQSDKAILDGMKNLANGNNGVEIKGEREFEYKGVKVTVPAPRYLM